MVRQMHTCTGRALRSTCRPYHHSARLYDALLGHPMLPLFIRNFAFLARHYHLFFRAIADVGCGTGGFVYYLCRWGVPVIGVDLSPAMIAIAQRRNRGNQSLFLAQDMRQLRLPHRVDLITCNFDTLNYLLTARDLQRAFRSFNRNLTMGGHLLFDMIVASGQPWRPGRRVLKMETPGLTSVWTITLHPRRLLRRVVMQHSIARRNGTRRCEREVHTQRAYPLGIIVDALHRCGFALMGRHHAFSLLPAGARDTRVVFVAKKTPTRPLAPP